MSILTKADELINGDRNVSYGHPRDNFKAIADQWQSYLQNKPQPVTIEAIDVANMMILLKVARVIAGVYHEDSYTDIAGYAGTAERLQEPVADGGEDRVQVLENGTSWLVDGRRFWSDWEDIPDDTEVNSADESDDMPPWTACGGSEYGIGPWREYLGGKLAAESPAPRVWRRLPDVSGGVSKVVDAEGFTWERRGRCWGWVNDGGEWTHIPARNLRGTRSDAPYTEVLEAVS